MKVANLHCDTICELYKANKENNPISLSQNSLQIDVNKLGKGNYLLQNFAVFIDRQLYAKPYTAMNEAIELYIKEIYENREFLEPVYTWQDIVHAGENNKIAALLTIEDAGNLASELEGFSEKALFDQIYYRLINAYIQGVRLITLSWNYPTIFSKPNVTLCPLNEVTPNTTEGLTPLGFQLIDLMENMGFMIDVSHLSDKGFYDVLKHCTKAPLASHSSARKITPMARNMSDEMIQALARKGGIIGLNFFGKFIKPFIGLGMEFSHPVSNPYTSIEDMATHLRHMIKIGGIESVALGSDFDGIDTNLELKDCSYMPLFAEKLENLGFTYSEIEHIFYKNVLRYYKESLY